ncbi:uncharacterized protein METZ01_LOCUS494866, partial [marine metagenome]
MAAWGAEIILPISIVIPISINLFCISLVVFLVVFVQNLKGIFLVLIHWIVSLIPGIKLS